jgi:hypothetical protein
MKKIKLTFNQSKKVSYNQEKIRINRNGFVLYIQDSEYGLIVTDWCGNVVDVDIQLDECFQ